MRMRTEDLEILKDVVSDAHKIREVKKDDDEEIAKRNAWLVGYLVSTRDVRPLEKGMPRYTRYLQEQERKRQIKELDKDGTPRIRAREIADMMKKHGNRRSAALSDALVRTQVQEEKERQRRMMDKREAVSRRMRSRKLSLDMHVQGPIIKAQLHKYTPPPPSMEVSRIEQVVSAASDTYNAVAPVVKFVTLVGIGMAMEAGNAAAQRFPTAAAYVPSVPSMWGRVRSIVTTMKQNVQTYTTPPAPVDIKALEETERFRRILEDPVDMISEMNANRVARLIKGVDLQDKLPRHNGLRRFTSRLEEKERSRRMSNKDDALNSRMNAQRIADIIHECIHAPNSKFFKRVDNSHITRALEEEERETRMAMTLNEAFNCRWRARNVAQLIHEVNFPSNNREFLHIYTASLEEEERLYRNRDPSIAMRNARALSDVFSQSKFFVGERRTPVLKSSLEMLEQERKPSPAIHAVKKMARRFSLVAEEDKSESKRNSFKLDGLQEAQEHASNFGEILSHDVKLMQENEKQYRMNDKLYQQQATHNARKVSELISAHFSEDAAPTKQIAEDVAVHHNTPPPERSVYAPILECSIPMTQHALLAAPPHAITPPASPLTVPATTTIPTTTATPSEITPDYPSAAHQTHTVHSIPPVSPRTQPQPHTQTHPQPHTSSHTHPSTHPHPHAQPPPPQQVAFIPASQFWGESPKLAFSPSTYKPQQRSDAITESPRIPAHITVPTMHPLVNTSHPLQPPKKSSSSSSKLRTTFVKRLNKESPPADRSAKDIQLAENVRKQYEAATHAARKELAKVERLRLKIGSGGANSIFGDYRLQRHQNAALKHQKAAARHKQWLDEKDSVLAPAPSL